MRLFVTGTDTDAGKTIFSAALAGALGASYWKPIQAGSLERTDSDIVRHLSGLAPARVLPEGYRLGTSCSPHLAAELDGRRIELNRLSLPDADPLVVEGAGGLLVPVNRELLVVDLISTWQLPAVLVARTTLGTINHSLLSVEALRTRGIALLGVAFVGESNPQSEEIVCTLGKTRRLGRLPIVDPLDSPGLARAFAANFTLGDFQ
jgi:dethiobiotin synthetase